jgi:hypothetical protein
MFQNLPLVTNADTGFAQSLQEGLVVNAEAVSGVLGVVFSVDFSLLLTRTLFELHFSHMHNT